MTCREVVLETVRFAMKLNPKGVSYNTLWRMISTLDTPRQWKVSTVRKALRQLEKEFLVHIEKPSSANVVGVITIPEPVGLWQRIPLEWAPHYVEARKPFRLSLHRVTCDSQILWWHFDYDGNEQGMGTVRWGCLLGNGDEEMEGGHPQRAHTAISTALQKVPKGYTVHLDAYGQDVRRGMKAY
jgi:hypothetical protein